MDLTTLHLHWRQSAYNGKTYKSYSLARAFREDGKNRREIVLKLGKLTDDQAEFWKNILKASRSPSTFLASADDIAVLSHKSFLDVCVAAQAWDDWGLDRAFPGKGKRIVDVAKIAKLLVINRNVDPGAKSSVPKWAKSTILPDLLGIPPSSLNASRIFRELEVIEDCKDEIASLIFTKLRRDDPDSFKLVFYDLSSSRFHGSKCSLVKWGHCKEGYEHHVVLALVVNQDGFPFYWEVMPGGTSDANTMSWLLQRLRDKFATLEATLVFDRGFVSSQNLVKIEAKKIMFITALDKPQIENHTDIDFQSLAFLTPETVEYHLVRREIVKRCDAVTYYAEVKMTEKRRYILGFNVELYGQQRKTREKIVAEFFDYVEKLNRLLRVARNDRDRSKTYRKFRDRIVKDGLDSFLDVKLSETTSKFKNDFDELQLARTYQATVVLDEKAKSLAGRLDGYWMLVTNHIEKNGSEFVVSGPEIIKAYRDKHVIESSFRDLKSFVEVSPVYLWTEKHVRAHYTVCVIAHLLNRYLCKRLKENPGSESSDIISAPSLFSALQTCMLNRIKINTTDATIDSITSPSAVHKDLLVRLDMSALLKPDFIRKSLPGTQP